MDLAEQLERVAGALEDGGIPYALVGGLAVAVWGAPRATQDIDLLVLPVDVDAALTAVEPLGFRLRALPMTFRDGMRLQRVSRIERGALLTLDLLVVNDALEPAFASRQRIELSGAAIWVVSRDALIAMKVAAGRPRDALDVESLLELDR